MKWAKSFEGAELIAAFPRYNPRWAWWVVQVPILRELLDRQPRIGAAAPSLVAKSPDFFVDTRHFSFNT